MDHPAFPSAAAAAACRAVEAATLGKLNKHLAGELPAAKPDKEKNLPEGLWLPPNTALQVRQTTWDYSSHMRAWLPCIWECA
jgi:hypothetical protein